MSARNNAEDVKAVWEPPSTNFDSTINTVAALANRFVNDRLQGQLCSDSGQAISEGQLKDVELFLTCYFLSTRKKENVSGSMLGVSASRQGGFGFTGMMGNLYGQMAVELDCTGKLRDIVARANAAARGDVDAQTESAFLLVSDADLDILD